MKNLPASHSLVHGACHSRLHQVVRLIPRRDFRFGGLTRSPKTSQNQNTRNLRSGRKHKIEVKGSKDANVVTIITFKAFRQASLVVPAPPSPPSGATLGNFLSSPASHAALLDSPLFYPVPSEGPGVYKCQGWEARVLALRVSPVLKVRIESDPEEAGALRLDVVGTEFTGLGEESLNSLVDLTSSNKVRWREEESEDGRGGRVIRLSTTAQVNVTVAVPKWMPVAPTLLETAGSQAVQLILDDTLPDFLRRMLDAYQWWAGVAGRSSSSSQLWRTPAIPPGGIPGGGGVLSSLPPAPAPPASSSLLPAQFQNLNTEDTQTSSTPSAVTPPSPTPPPSSAPAAPSAETTAATSNFPDSSDTSASDNPTTATTTATRSETEVSSVKEAAVVMSEESRAEDEDRAPDRGDGMWDKFYQRKDQLSVFEARRTLVLPVREPNEANGRPLVSVNDYLHEPERLVEIVYGKSQYERIGDIFRIRLIAINIMKWSVVPIYELKMRFDGKTLLSQSGTVGLDPNNLPEMFEGMELLMRLDCVTEVVRDKSRIKVPDATCQLEAYAELAIAADIPTVLKMLPGVKTIGDGILDAILAAVELASKLKLESDYLKYVEIRRKQLAKASAVVPEIAAKVEDVEVMDAKTVDGKVEDPSSEKHNV